MSYYTINNIPIYISNKTDKIFSDIWGREKSAMQLIARHLKGEENNEYEIFCYDFLLDVFNSNKEIFKMDFEEFEFVGNDCKFEIFDLIYDYCNYYGHARIVDERNFEQRIIADYSGLDLSFPSGKIYILQHVVRPYRWWWRYTNNIMNRKINILLDTSKIHKIRGTLEEFTIYFENYYIICGKDIEIKL